MPQIKQCDDTKVDCTWPSICIPRVPAKTTKARVLTVMRKVIGSGLIRHIELLNMHDKANCPYSMVFVHLSAWPETGRAAEIRQRLLDGKLLYIACRDASVWRCASAWRSRAGRTSKHNLGIA